MGIRTRITAPHRDKYNNCAVTVRLTAEQRTIWGFMGTQTKDTWIDRRFAVNDQLTQRKLCDFFVILAPALQHLVEIKPQAYLF